MTAGGVARTPAALTVEVEYTVARLAASTVEAAAPWARWRQVHAATLPVSGRILDCMEDCHTGALRQTGSDSEVGQRGWKEALSGVKGYQQHASTRDEDLLRPQLEDSSSLQQKRRFRRRFKVMDGLQRGGWNEWKRVRSKDKALTQSFGLAKGFARVYGARTGGSCAAFVHICEKVEGQTRSAGAKYWQLQCGREALQCAVEAKDNSGKNFKMVNPAKTRTSKKIKLAEKTAW
ncbi:hypothetical protein AK812_SmicGene25553 [Symbiodinium microadriaticum]|uniref:Uncharacterized protein n=1 Tax=Symbiodinium microadriaticum TaxID=2951 RepID=A0A1Q9DBN3_SYMMI|nr:hypothetical protein AK812_SmicGene25553 [Symbiodinium microadriaticum]